MGMHRPFRFGVFASPSAHDWADSVRHAEALGYGTVSMGEHVFLDIAPIAALASAAVLTSTIRVSSLTFGNDFRNPIVLAKEAATIDVLSGGRFEFGLGSGYMRADYDQTGIPFDAPGKRLDRFFEAVRLIKRAFAEETVDHSGEYYSVRGLSLKPKSVQRPAPPILIGGGGRRMLEFAGREADIVGINIKATPEGGIDWDSISSRATEKKIEWVRDAAGPRFSELEFHLLVNCLAITDDPEAAAARYIQAFHGLGATEAISAQDLLASPKALIGSEEAIVEMIQRRREEYGISYITIAASKMEEFAPIVARLSGT